MVPMFVEPSLEKFLEFGEVDDTPDIIYFIARHVKIGDVIVAVKVFAFSAMPVKPMAGAEPNATHNRDAHVRLGRGLGGRRDSCNGPLHFACVWPVCEAASK